MIAILKTSSLYFKDFWIILYHNNCIWQSQMWHISEAFSVLVSDSPLHHCCLPPAPHTSHPSCVRNTFHPATSFPHFILHMFLNLFLPISLSWSTHFPPSNLPISVLLSLLCDSLITLDQSSFWGPGTATASQSPSLVPSVPVSLSVTLKRFRLPDMVCSACAAAGQKMGGIGLETRISLALDWISLDIFSGLSQPSRR